MNWVTLVPWQGFTWSSLASLSAQAGLLILIAAGLSLLLGRSRPQFRHLVWVLVLARLALPVMFLSPLGFLPTLQTGDVLIEEQAARVAAGARVEEFSSILSAMTARSAGLIWLVGVLVIGGVTLRRALRLRKVISQSSKSASAHLTRKVERLSGELGLSRAPKVRVLARDSALAGPALFGVIRPILLLPASTSKLWSEETLEPVLVHELTHLRRFDHYVNALQWIIQVLYFFHPLVWWANHRLRTERELATDDEVAGRCGRQPYLAALLLLAESRVDSGSLAPTCVAMAESRRLLPQRIRRMSRMKTKPSLSSTRARLLLASVVAAVLFSVLLSACQPPETVSPGESKKVPLIPGIDGVSEPLRIDGVTPMYPELARKARQNGKVILQIVVKATGEVGDISVLNAPEPDPGFSESAVNAVRQWRYRPATKDNDPVDATITVVVRFRLDSEGGGGEEESAS